MGFLAKLKHFLIPHENNHYKAHALRIESLLVYVFLLVLALVSLKALSSVKPGILGISSTITNEEVINITNQKREEAGILPLRENPRLSQAASEKALEMFAQGYWAHISPSGKKPWDFINNADYRYISAGENLAMDFPDSVSVVNAWMSSPTHRSNILESSFKDIGVVVLRGNFKGYQTTLVVQMFGEPTPEILAHAKRTIEQKESQTFQTPILNQYKIGQYFSLALLLFIAMLLLFDAFWQTRAKIARISSHTGAHFIVLLLVILVLVFSESGAII